MKARVKSTGEIVEVEDCGSVFRHGALFHAYKDANGTKYIPDEIELQMDFDYWEACQDETPDSPDYWTRLEHQYAGMAMQGILTNPIGFENIRARGMNIQIETALLASEFAHALVQKMKEERK